MTKWYYSIIAIKNSIAIFGRTKRKHNSNLLNVMQVAQRNSLVFNSAKCDIQWQEITFNIYMLTSDCTIPDTTKANGIAEMLPPTNFQQLQSFLGMINFMQPFISHMSHHKTPWRELLKKGKTLTWDEVLNQAFKWLRVWNV